LERLWYAAGLHAQPGDEAVFFDAGTVLEFSGGALGAGEGAGEGASEGEGKTCVGSGAFREIARRMGQLGAWDDDTARPRGCGVGAFG
jgi:hypothetical protein